MCSSGVKTDQFVTDNQLKVIGICEELATIVQCSPFIALFFHFLLLQGTIIFTEGKQSVVGLIDSLSLLSNAY